MTETISLNENGISEAVERSSEVIGRGGLIVYPTDTIYGFGVDPELPDAIERLYSIKERNDKKLFSLILSGIEMLYGLFSDLSPLEKKVIDNLLPGAITIILNNSTGNKVFGETVGVRIPNNDFCLQLVKFYGKPITTTSVNKSGMTAATSVTEVTDQFSDAIDLIIDGGKSPQRKGSTVIQVVDEKINILRQGDFSEEVLRELSDKY